MTTKRQFPCWCVFDDRERPCLQTIASRRCDAIAELMRPFSGRYREWQTWRRKGFIVRKTWLTERD